MITDVELADLCLAIYDTTSVWGHLWTDDVYVGLKFTTDGDVVCFRGSITIDDWIRDIEAVPVTVAGNPFGPVHAGFLAGVEVRTAQIVAALRPDQPLYLTGHSLGGARAWLCAALMLGLVRWPTRVVTFGSPRPGFPTLRTYLASVDSVAYENVTPQGHDRVPDLPPVFLPEMPWVVPARQIARVNVTPDPGDYGPFNYHHMVMYRKGLGS